MRSSSSSYILLPTSSGPPSPSLAYFPLLYVHPPRSYRSNLVLGLVCVTLASVSALLGLLVFDSPVALDGLREGWWDGRATAAGLMPPMGKMSEGERLELLRGMVERTEGYYARDWSLWLGWNNIRYILEASLWQSYLLNRTLLLPSHVYLRSCEYAHEACAAFAPQVNRGDAVGTDEWRDLPDEEQQAWVVPIGRMVDLDRLRGSGWRVLTGEEFGLLEGLEEGWELGNGSFPLELPLSAHTTAGETNSTRLPLTIHRIRNEEYEPANTIRIDRPLPPPQTPPRGAELVIQQTLASLEPLLKSLEKGLPIAWPEASAYIKRDLGSGLEDTEVETALRWAGYERVYTLGAPYDMSKTVAQPSSFVVDPKKTVAFADEFRGRKERIVHLRGEVHLHRPPGAMYFSSAEEANRFATMAIRDVRPLPEVERLGARLAERMRELVGGRMWSAAHMRRGDFVRYGWAPSQSLETHLASVRYQLEHGRQILEYIQMHTPARKPRISGFEADESMWALDPPAMDDPFYIATDDRNATSLALIREYGGVLLSDLLTPEDREELVGWPLLFTDILSQVEQEIMARAAFFYGSKLSSVSGGVLNRRVELGKDPRTAELT